jgi:hypothetical protein
MVDEGDMFGDGVNVAARIEAIAAPGEICVSGSVRDQIGKKLPIGFADMGQHGVKNIARPVRVYRVEKRGEPRTAPPDDEVTAPLALPDRPSIAVLPFANMSGDPDQDYFVDGMVEDIITGLSRIRWLFVIARNSSFAYKGKSPDIRQVGRELGVRYVLDGSVRAGRWAASASPASWSRPRAAGTSGPNATIARSTTSSRCRTRSPSVWSERSSRACVGPRSSASGANARSI